MIEKEEKMFSDDIVGDYYTKVIGNDNKIFENQTKEQALLTLKIIMAKNCIAKEYDKISKSCKQERLNDIYTHNSLKNRVFSSISKSTTNTVNEEAILFEMVQYMLDKYKYIERFGRYETDPYLRANSLINNNLIAQDWDKELTIKYLLSEVLIDKRLDLAVRMSTNKQVASIMNELSEYLVLNKTKHFDKVISDTMPKYAGLSEIDIVNSIMQTNDDNETKEYLKALQYVYSKNSGIEPANFKVGTFNISDNSLGFYSNVDQTIQIDYNKIKFTYGSLYKESLINVVLHETAHRIQHQKSIGSGNDTGNMILVEDVYNAYINACTLDNYLQPTMCQMVEKQARDVSIQKMLEYAHNDKCMYKDRLNIFAYNYALSDNNVSGESVLPLLRKEFLCDKLKPIYDELKGKKVSTYFQGNSREERRNKFGYYVFRKYNDNIEEYEKYDVHKNNGEKMM